MTVHPALAKSFKTRMTWYAAKLSKPLVGSSKQTISGFVMSSTPMAVRFRWPPDIPLMTELPMYVSAHRRRPKAPNNSSMSILVDGDSSWSKRRAAENWSASRGVAVASISSFCITYAIRDRNCRGFTGRPAIKTRPVMDTLPCLPPLIRPARTFKSVVFPHPLGPKMHVSSQDLAVPFIPSNMMPLRFLHLGLPFCHDATVRCSHLSSNPSEPPKDAKRDLPTDLSWSCGLDGSTKLSMKSSSSMQSVASTSGARVSQLGVTAYVLDDREGMPPPGDIAPTTKVPPKASISSMSESV
mmetsp:Transcript_5238/g.11659  ORF Transcript_5238/g.11659 Transcript_5238/m.11659 type:complete len:298 (-) Transcript_5238:132-1025(-)